MHKYVSNLIVRYSVLLAFGILQLQPFYSILTHLTVYPVFWVISLFDVNASLLTGEVIFFSGIYARIVPACVAGAAYYLLVILNLSTPLKIQQRIQSLLFLLLGFLALNITRILVFAALAARGSSYFDLAHTFVWYFGSTVLVVFLWFAGVLLFGIRKIPIYSDMQWLLGQIKRGKKRN